MRRQITLGQYRAIDLTILMVSLAVSQLLIYLATSFWYPEQMYVASPVAGITALILMRWSGWAAVPAVLGGVLYAFLEGGTVQHLVIFGAGNLFSLLSLLLLRIYGKERIRKDSFLSMVFAFCTQLLMQLGRAGIAAAFGWSAAACIGFITTDVLSLLFTMLIIWIARRIEGLFEDQKHYLLRIQKQERHVERGEPY